MHICMHICKHIRLHICIHIKLEIRLLAGPGQYNGCADPSHQCGALCQCASQTSCGLHTGLMYSCTLVTASVLTSVSISMIKLIRVDKADRQRVVYIHIYIYTHIFPNLIRTALAHNLL